MYAIMSGGELVALCDKPRYVKINKNNGVYIEAKADEAIAVSVNGNLYNINGGDVISDAPQAVVVHRDGGEIVFRSRKQIEESEAAIGIIEDAICEIDAEASRVAVTGDRVKPYSSISVVNGVIGGTNEDILSKIWAKRLIAGTKTWAEVPMSRQGDVKAILARRVENGVITAEQHAKITGEEFSAPAADMDAR